MAHSLFEPAPTPLRELIWQRVKAFSVGGNQDSSNDESTAVQTDPALLQQSTKLDARGRLELLEAVLTSKPIKNKAARS
ncbi:hypothetical protein ABVF61_28725 [Roseibium sp. HPY-6]|uniref:hypothetical protein n=1 Tax=Roseibium sp. HPY-6 TaxID=3229852 RepID=UPI00338DEFAC